MDLESLWQLFVIAWMGVAAVTIAFVFWRYPKFRQAFRHHWSSEQVAKRMNAWAERQRR